MNLNFDGYNVIITGGTRGIGRAAAEMFLQNGCRVTAVFAGNETAADEFRNSWAGFPLETVRLDVADYAAVEKFYREYDKTHSSLEVLVNCAGIRRDSVVGMMSPADWNAVINVNLTGTFNMSKFAVHRMMQGRFGRIISITSPSGRVGIAGQANYAASKAAQVAFSKTLAREVARRGITVNCISPGFIETDLIADLSDELRKEYKSQVPSKRFGTPDEVAATILFAASREAAYINGETIEVSGGL